MVHVTHPRPLVLYETLLIALVVFACGNESSSTGSDSGASGGFGGSTSSHSSTGGSVGCFATDNDLAIAYLDALQSKLSGEAAASRLFATEAQFLHAVEEVTTNPPCSSAAWEEWKEPYSDNQAEFVADFEAEAQELADWSSCVIVGADGGDPVPYDCAECAPIECGMMTTWGEDPSMRLDCGELGTQFVELPGLSMVDGCWFILGDPS